MTVTCCAFTFYSETVEIQLAEEAGLQCILNQLCGLRSYLPVIFTSLYHGGGMAQFNNLKNKQKLKTNENPSGVCAQRIVF